MNIREYIKKLQDLPESKKKIIFFTIIAVAALIMTLLEVKFTGDSLSKIGNSLQSINLPKINIPDNQANVSNDNAIAINSSPISTPMPSPEDQTSDWTTYTSDKYGFEVKYPSNLLIREHVFNNSFTSLRFEDNGIYPFWIAFGNSNGKNIADMTNLKSSDYSELKNDTLSVNDINWNSIEGITTAVENKDKVASLMNVYTKKADLTYVFQCVNCNADLFGDDGKAKELIFKQMISTFKFTSK